MSDTRNGVTITIATGTIIKVMALVAAAALIYFLRDVVLIVFIAFILATLIEPLVDWLESRKIPRSLSVVVLYVVLFFVLFVIVRLLVPPIVEQVQSLANTFPETWQKVMTNIDAFRAYSDQHGISDNIQQGLRAIESELTALAGGLYGFIIAIFRNLLNFTFILVIAFYLVVERNALRKLLLMVTPEKEHEQVATLVSRIQSKILDWAKGQLLLGAIIGFLVFAGLMVLLPRYALILGIVAGITELVPYVGPILGSIPAIFLAFAVSPWLGLMVLILYIVVQWLENNFIVPGVMKKQLNLNPVVVLVGMMIGSRLANIIGMILTIPVLTIGQVILKDLMERATLKGVSKDINR